MSKIEYKPEVCEHCGQTETYLLGLDHGTVDIVRAIAKKIGEKGINIVHPRGAEAIVCINCGKVLVQCW